MKKKLMSTVVLMFMITTLLAQQITKAEYFFNTDPGQGLAIALPVTPGDSVTINNSIPIPANLQTGINLLFVRTANNNGTWSFPEVSLLWISSAVKKLNAFEYFFDTDPGIGNGSKTFFTPADSIILTQSIAIPGSLQGGLHLLFVRVQNEQGTWSMPEVYLVSVTNGFENLSAAEYFFDTDPGIGIATPISFPTPGDSINHIQNIPVPALSIGMHTLYVRTKNTAGIWSFPEVHPINICTAYGPKSSFTHYRNGSDIYFSDSSTNTISRKWLFGDNTSDTSTNPRHNYATGNNYTVKLITTNSCGNDTLTRIIGIPGIQSILPANAPSTGIYIGYIKGVGFVPGTTTSLIKNGSSTILADTTIFIDSTSLKVIFKNKNEDLGKYDLLINVPGNGQMNLDTAVSIEPPTPSNIWVRLEGRKEVLINKWSTFHVVFGNNGNQTAVGIPIVIKLPKNIQAKIIDPTLDSFVVPAIQPYLPEGRFYMAADSFVHDSVMIGSFLIPYLEAGATGNLTLEVRSASANAFYIKTETGKPWFDDTIFITGKNINRGTSFCDPPPCVKCLLDIIGFTPAGCVPATYNFLCKFDDQLNDAKGGGKGFSSIALDYLGNWGGWALSCIGGLTPAGAIAKVASGLDKASGGFSAAENCFNCRPIPPHADTVRVRFSWDPNAKSGPGGYNTLNYTRWQDPFNYSIHFENEASASAPASEVTITDYLDTSKFDIKSLRFTGFGFADTSVRYTIADTLVIRDIDLRPAKNAIVRVTGQLDSVNKLRFHFATFDPLTMSLTNSINDGFLNPNTNGTEGLGYVSFRINPRSDLITGTVVNNTASIVFDNNPPILTPIWFNGIDKEKPNSHVLPITEKINDTTYNIRWTGSDAHAGLFFYRIMVSDNDSAYREWIATDTTAAHFTVKLTHTYKFYSIAQDYVDNIEDAPGTPDQVLSVILPVTWLEFKAYRQNNFSHLEWSTATEQNNRGFEVQRSANGNNYSAIGFVNGTGNSNSIRYYSFIDSMPLKGINYYRLKQVNIDNKTSFSNVRQVKFPDETMITLRPNPVRDKLMIELPGHDITQVRISDVSGKILWQTTIVNAVMLEVQTEKFLPGVYFVQLVNRDGKQIIKKFIKQ